MHVFLAIICFLAIEVISGTQSPMRMLFFVGGFSPPFCFFSSQHSGPSFWDNVLGVTFASSRKQEISTDHSKPVDTVIVAVAVSCSTLSGCTLTQLTCACGIREKHLQI